jgi:hypothetical protein
MDSTKEIPHGEGPDHAVLKQEHVQMQEIVPAMVTPARRTLTIVRVARVACDGDPVAR